MKRKLKLLAVDAAIVVINIIFFSMFEYSFSPLKFGNFLLTVFVPFASGAVHYLAYQKMPLDSDEVMSELNSIVQNEEMQFDTYMTHLKNIKHANPDFNYVIEEFMTQLEAFSKKEDALKYLINLNDGKSQGFLLSKNNEVQAYLVRNLKKFVKHLIVYGAKTKKNRSSSIENDKEITSILESNEKMIDGYDKLLDEVAKMGNGFNIKDPGLQSAVENLQMLRGGTEGESNEEIQLLVSTGQGTN